MNGFITESVSKLSDGLGTVIKLLAALLITSLLFTLVEQTENFFLVIIFLVLVLVGGTFFLFRSLITDLPETKKAVFGMLSGLLFWQVFIQSGKLESLGIQNTSFLFFFLLFIAIVVWKKGIPTGLCFMTLIFSVSWVCQQILLVLNSQGTLAYWLPGFIYLVRYLAIAGIALSLWFILFKSENAMQRIRGALILFSFVLLTISPF